MIDIITHVSDMNTFRSEVEQKANDGFYGLHIEDGVVTYGVQKIPVHYNGNESLSVVRLSNEDEIATFESIESCSRLGVVVDLKPIFDTEDDRLTYERVRGDRVVSVTMPDGKVIESELPYLIGGFQ